MTLDILPGGSILQPLNHACRLARARVTTVRVSIRQENHNFFDPEEQNLWFRSTNSTHAGINFIDRSLFTINGTVHYENYSTCVIDSAEILIKYLGDTEFKSTEPPTYTGVDDVLGKGKYALSIEPDKTFALKARYKDHDIGQSYSFYNINNTDYIWHRRLKIFLEF